MRVSLFASIAGLLALLPSPTIAQRPLMINDEVRWMEGR